MYMMHNCNSGENDDKPLGFEVPYWAKSPVAGCDASNTGFFNAKIGDVEIPSLRMLNED